MWGKLMALELSHNYKLEMLRAQLTPKLTPLQMRGLFPGWGDAPVTLEPHAQKAENVPTTQDALNDLGSLIGLGHGASNEWVIAGSRTATGKPILANDPHLGLSAPILWYLVRIVTPQLSMAGATVPGLPVVLLGQNDSIAWGMTTTGSDVEDLFIETIDPKNPLNYLTPQGSVPFVTRTEYIRIKGKPDLPMHVRISRHGPVMSDIDPHMAQMAGSGRVVALAFTGLGPHDTTAEALMRINRAHNWQEFTDALKLYQSPPQNFVFASKDGDIGFFAPGLVPVRRKGEGLVPADGASGDYDWQGAIPFDEEPQIHNPPAGFIFNANNEIAAPGGGHFLGVDWEEPYRSERLQQFFDSIPRHTLDTSAMMQADHLSLAARQLLPYLLRLKPADQEQAEVLDHLRQWDGVMDKTRPEPLIFEAWLYEMHRLLLVDPAGQDLLEKGPFAAAGIANILAHQGSGWCTEKTCTTIMAQALTDALDLLSARDGADKAVWEWGDEHRAQLLNKVFTHVPLLRHWADIDAASSGDFYTLDRGGGFEPSPAHPFTRTDGGGYRGIYDLADPARSRFMIASGQSGHLFSSHYRDLFKSWNRVQSFTLAGSEQDLAARHLPELVFEPTR